MPNLSFRSGPKLGPHPTAGLPSSLQVRLAPASGEDTWKLGVRSPVLLGPVTSATGPTVSTLKSRVAEAVLPAWSSTRIRKV